MKTLDQLSPDIDKGAWLEYRRLHITGTDVAQIMGISPFGSAYSVWADKTGRSEPKEVSSFMTWGNRMEKSNAEWLSDELGTVVRQTNSVVESDKDGRWACTPDGFVHQNGEVSLWEGKAPSFHSRSKWEEGVPLHYQTQPQWNMMVCGLDSAYISALIPPAKAHDKMLFFERLEANEAYIEHAQDVANAFWENHVLKDIPPAASVADLDVLKSLTKEANDYAVELSSEVADAWGHMLDARRAANSTTTISREYETIVRQAIGDARFGVLPDGSVISMNVTERKAYEVKASSHRTPRACKALPDNIEIREGF